jgi:hypothetical protein
VSKKLISAIATKNVLAMARLCGKDEASLMGLITLARTDDAALRSLISEIKVMLQSQADQTLGK